jgi:hypothetical protein
MHHLTRRSFVSAKMRAAHTLATMMPGLCLIIFGTLLSAVGTADESNDSVQTAIDELKKLGARVFFRPLESDEDDDDPESKRQVSAVLIGQDWKGSDEGLKYIEQIPKLPTLYVVGRTKISEERFAKLKKAMPDLAIERRSGAYLGVSPISRNGCLITRVASGSPADKAGLKQGDTIQKIDQKTVQNVNDLLTALQPKEPGDEVDLTVLQESKSITIKVKLDKWPQ